MRCILAVMFLLAAAAGSLAADVDCNNALDQFSMNMCADRSLKASDATLNATYKRLLARLGDEASKQKLLVAAQRDWVAFRDAECAFGASGVEGGSVYPMIRLQCADDLTTRRTKDLDAYLHCQEGDLSCPAPPGP